MYYTKYYVCMCYLLSSVYDVEKENAKQCGTVSAINM